MKLSGKVAVITGAARGIGRACAERFLKEGAKVVVSDIDADGLARTASELVRANDVRVVLADVAKHADVDRLVATAAKEFGRIDIMVNNAGVARNQDLLEISEKDFDDVIAINLKGAFFGVQAAAKQMIAQGGGGGVIINMSSVNALLAIPSLATYAISKGGMKQLTSVAAVALAPHKIRVVAVGPGTILTDMVASATSPPKMRGAAYYRERRSGAVANQVRSPPSWRSSRATMRLTSPARPSILTAAA
jgi:glucose 1-dehydrogenase